MDDDLDRSELKLVKVLSVPIDAELDNLTDPLENLEESSEELRVQEVNVVVRVRKSVESQSAVNVAEDGKRISVSRGRMSVFGKKESTHESYDVTRAFKPNESQLEVFHGIGRDPAKDAMRGHTTLIAAIGNTGTGKTHTLYGPPPIFEKRGEGYHEQDVGLVFRVLDHVMQKLKKRSDLKHFEIRLSIFELFCEGKSTLIRDLLNLKHVALSKDDSFLGDVTWKKVNDRKQAAGYISEAFKCRKVSSHNLNQHSSRSFLFMPIKVCQWVTEVDILEGEMMFVDFAGWEQAKNTGAMGRVLQEATFINTQLLGWSQCLDALALGKAHVPYSDCALTRLLKRYLQESVVTMILTVSPDLSRAADTGSLLRKIKNISKIITKSRRHSRRATINERLIRNSVFPGQIEQLELENYGLRVKQQDQDRTISELQKKLKELTEAFQDMPRNSMMGSPSSSAPRGRRSISKKRFSISPARTDDKWDLDWVDSSDDADEMVPDPIPLVQNHPQSLKKQLTIAEKTISELSVRLEGLESTLNVASRLETLEDKISTADKLSKAEERIARLETQLHQTHQTHPKAGFYCCTII